MAKKIILTVTLCLAALFVVAVAAFGITQYYIPYHQAICDLPAEGKLILTQQKDGTVLLSWPEGTNVDKYLVELVNPQTEEIEYSCYITGKTSHVLPSLPKEFARTIRITGAAEYSVPFQDAPKLRLSDCCLEVTDCFSPPEIQVVNWTPDPNADRVDVTLGLGPNCAGRLYTLDNSGKATLAATLNGNKVSLSFGENHSWQVPAKGEMLTFAFDAYRTGEGYIYYGGISQTQFVVHDDFIDTELNLSYTALGNNKFGFSWNETLGTGYLLQCRPVGTYQWQDLLTVDADGTRSYTTDHLPAFTQIEYRVIALGNVPEIKSPVLNLLSGPSVIYSTIWPIQDLNIYADAQKSDVLGMVPKASALCVLDLEDGMFRIRWGDIYGYVNSNYCMINLPEYLGDLCLYNITNSYSSMYAADIYPIPSITGEVIVGYEQVRLSENEYLVPLLFPTAQKLEQAAKAAIAEGYKLKIYDSYRPQAATEWLYNTTFDFGSGFVPLEDETAEPITFHDFMTDNGRYTMNYFIAKGTSQHNKGVAMDLTLVALDPSLHPPIIGPDGEEIPVVMEDGELCMQTAMHNLTWFSERARNNDCAKLLHRFMSEAGFSTIPSEWWHYQDNDAIVKLGPPPLYDGVSFAGFVADDFGWKYRNADGTFAVDCTIEMDGVIYIFDANGYLTE